MFTAEQKIRMRLTGDPHGEPHFQHEGPNVIRLIAGGIEPVVRVRLETLSDETTVICPICNVAMGSFDAHYGSSTYKQIADVRNYAYQHQKIHKET